jgi:PAS domain S-box-containing protein
MSKSESAQNIRSSATPSREALLARVASLEAELDRLRAGAAAQPGRRADLAETDELFRLIADSVPQIVWVADAEGRVRFFNRYWTVYTGAVENPASAAATTADYVHRDDAAPTMAAWEEARRTGGTFQVEHRIRSASGEYRWFLVRAEAYRDPEAGEITHWFGTSTDIHRWKLAEQALQESEKRYRTLADLSPEPTWVNQDDRLVYANAAAARMIGSAGPEELLGRSPFEFVEPEYHAALHERIRSILEKHSTKLPVEMRWRRLDGSILDVESAAGRITWQGRPAIQVVFRDITERKRAENNLRVSEAKYRTLFESIDDGFCVIQMIFDEQGRPVDYRFMEGNPAWERHTGLRGAIGRTARELLPELEEHWFEIYGRVAKSRKPVRFESGSEVMRRWFDVFAFPVEEPELHKVALLFTDITTHKRSESALREAKHLAEAANESKAEFLAAMSHELRTPLNAIGGYVELLALGIHGPLTEPQKQSLARVAANQRHLLALINDILSFARLEAGKMRLDLQMSAAREIVNSLEALVSAQAEARGIAYAHEACDTHIQLLADAERVRQILLNLISNAIKFTPEGGRVTLSCDEGEAWVNFRVADNGPGIPAEDQERIFDPFQQVGRRLNQPQEGVGLGLAISRDLARSMGGDLTVASVPGEGSTFTLRLPRIDPDA